MPHGDETGRGDRQVYGVRGSGGAGGSGRVDEVGHIWGSEVVDGLKCKQEDFEFETELNREPVELLEDRGDVVDGWGSSYNAGS